MNARDYFTWQSDEFGFFWKYQLLLGTLLILSGILIVAFPEILVAMAAAVVILLGAGLIGSALRWRRLERRTRGMSGLETIER
jgi:hypothetical protein